MASGMPLRRATVTRITDIGVFCSISTLGTPTYEFGPMDSGYFDLRVGDRVIVGQAGYETENFVVITSLTPRPMPLASIYYFETEADRDDILPSPLVPTFAWVQDELTLSVWTGAVWQPLSWDEARVDSIEAAATALTTRVTNLEGLVVSDTATIDLTLTGASWPKTLSAAVIANSIPLGDLSDVSVSGPVVSQVVRHNGTSWFNSLLSLDDLSGVAVSGPVTGQTIRYNGSDYVNAKLALNDLNDTSISGLVANQALVYNGSAWVSRGMPLGVIWLHAVATNTTFATNFNVDTDWYSSSGMTILANRSYKITSRVVVFTGGGAQLKVRGYLKVAGAIIMESGGVVVGPDASDVTITVTGAWNSGGSPGTITFAAGCGRLQGAQNIDMVARSTNWAEFIIEDLGPVRSD